MWLVAAMIAETVAINTTVAMIVAKWLQQLFRHAVSQCVTDRWRRGVVVNTLVSINVVALHWARLLLGWVTG